MAMWRCVRILGLERKSLKKLWRFSKISADAANLVRFYGSEMNATLEVFMPENRLRLHFDRPGNNRTLTILSEKRPRLAAIQARRTNWYAYMRPTEELRSFNRRHLRNLPAQHGYRVVSENLHDAQQVLLFYMKRLIRVFGVKTVNFTATEYCYDKKFFYLCEAFEKLQAMRTIQIKKLEWLNNWSDCDGVKQLIESKIDFNVQSPSITLRELREIVTLWMEKGITAKMSFSGIEKKNVRHPFRNIRRKNTADPDWKLIKRWDGVEARIFYKDGEFKLETI